MYLLLKKLVAAKAAADKATADKAKDGDKDKTLSKDDKDLFKSMTGIIIVLIIITAIFWFITIYLLITRWDTLARWARIVAVIFLIPGIPGGPLVSFIVVLFGRK